MGVPAQRARPTGQRTSSHFSKPNWVIGNQPPIAPLVQAGITFNVYGESAGVEKTLLSI